MSPRSQEPDASEPPQATTAARSDAARFVRTTAVFVALGAAIYAGVYAWSEQVLLSHARTNKFFLLHEAPPTSYDYLVLGASHAAALGYQDMTERLESMTGKRIVNLAIAGGGVRVSRLLYDYALTRHRTGGLLYIVDSFGFYSRQWNEERLQDTRLFLRAPFDSALASSLLRDPVTRSMGVDFALGFSKINNQDRFADDVTPDERSRFTRVYRPVKQIDDQRLEYLYPRTVDQAAFDRYLMEFDALLADAQARGSRVIVVKPPLPERVARRIPHEAAFDARLAEVLGRRGIVVHDFTHVGNDDALFYDTDHLNRAGVLRFFEQSLAPLLAESR
jgi:hypothetical protein